MFSQSSLVNRPVAHCSPDLSGAVELSSVASGTDIAPPEDGYICLATVNTYAGNCWISIANTNNNGDAIYGWTLPIRDSDWYNIPMTVACRKNQPIKIKYNLVTGVRIWFIPLAKEIL